ncbi:MAG: ferredoxin [Thermoleophilia bacterium]
MITHRIIIDRDLCSGFGACADADPETFAVGADGIAVARDTDAGPETALAAARACPMGAIRVVDGDGGSLV